MKKRIVPKNRLLPLGGFLLLLLLPLINTAFIEGDTSLLLPATDLYPPSSWTSTRVNPFMGTTPKLPSSYEVVCVPFCNPLKVGAKISSKYGYRPAFGRMHRGVDFAIPKGSAVYASWSGVVRVVGYEPKGFGHYIIIRHDNGFETVYAHLQTALVSRGTAVEAGTLIGESGNSGRSTAPHLHYEIRFLGSPIDPERIINFYSGVPHREIFTWTKSMYQHNPSRGYGQLKIYRLKEATTLDSLAVQKDWDIEDLCLLNGILPDMLLQKGRAIRVR